ncbi:rhomboid family intramembrane serine protease [Leptospira idonii]|uniref:Rhomboid family intramembrane serine protease n=1 Tax=Leptospira idonii TaxID=1193500 RepID=A0A4R9M3R6_9LEPT|nr:rhomboid family intramembrane serine protease [Leptospira idonii]TGN20752.1 rhomboid family intramembrane serine protease [Leptospira idonii]
MRESRREDLKLFGNPILHPLNLILIFNVLVYLIQMVAEQQLIYRFALIPKFFFSGAYWQVFTYGFLHQQGIIPFHLLFNMYAMYMMGNYLVPILGKFKFTLLYFLSQLGGGAFVVLSAYLNVKLGGDIPILYDPSTLVVGASGAVFGLLAIFGVFYPNAMIVIFIFPVRASNAAWVAFLVGYALSIFMNVPMSNTAHMGGMVTGILLYTLFEKYIQPKNLPTLPGAEWETLEESPNVPVKQSSPGTEELFSDQKKANEQLLSQISKWVDLAQIEAFLLDKQVPNANICPPSSFQETDPVCLRCDWLPNCALRKARN